MAEVTLSIAGRSYSVAAREGDEPHLRHLESLLQRHAADALRASGGLNQERTLVYLALILAESGRAAEIASLSDALRQSFPDQTPLLVAIGGLLRFAELAQDPDPPLRHLARHSRTTMIRTFRVAKLRLQPLPFA